MRHVCQVCLTLSLYRNNFILSQNTQHVLWACDHEQSHWNHASSSYRLIVWHHSREQVVLLPKKSSEMILMTKVELARSLIDFMSQKSHTIDHMVTYQVFLSHMHSCTLWQSLTQAKFLARDMYYSRLSHHCHKLHNMCCDYEQNHWIMFLQVILWHYLREKVFLFKTWKPELRNELNDS